MLKRYIVKNLIDHNCDIVLVIIKTNLIIGFLVKRTSEQKYELTYQFRKKKVELTYLYSFK